MRAPTSHDVALLAGVSQPTVSRALRDDPRVTAETRRRVREAAAALHYVPSRRGRNLSTRVTGQVALVVGDLGNPFYLEAIDRLHGAFDDAGRRVVVLTDPPGRPAPAEQLLDGSIDGAVLTTARLGSSLPGELAARGLPVVLFNRALDDGGLDACVSQNAAGGGEVARELLRLGHTRIAAIFGPAETSTGRDRERGFRTALATAGAPLAEGRIRRGPFAPETGDAALRELLAAADPPTAVFCGNDVIAIGALNAARALGVAVPAQLSVFGFDDIAPAAWDVLTLSTVRQDLAEMARRAAALLLARVDDPGRSAQRVAVPTRLVLRGSHGPAPGRAPSSPRHHE